jgi:uncharacterized membrane protein
MERTVIGARSTLAATVIIIMAAFILVGVILLFFHFLALLMMLQAGLVIAIIRSQTKSGKEMIILDDNGLTLNGGVMIGPIPWECIKDASIKRVLFEKRLRVDIVNLPKIWDVLGKETIKRIHKNKKTGENAVTMDVDLCKLRGIDLPALIRKYATEYQTQSL